MSTLKEICLRHFPIDITRPTVLDIINYVRAFELRDEHPQALNTSTLGVHLAHFYNRDQIHIFDTFGVDKQEFAREIHKASAVNTNFKVQSDPYNIFSIWVIHNLIKDKKLTNTMRQEAIMAVGKLLTYKFFTSLVHHRFPHRVNEEIMQYTIDNLSGKYSIKKKETSTWKLLIEDRVSTLLTNNSIHGKTLLHFTPDEKIFYVITDIQSRIRDNINNITREYHINKEHGAKVSSYGMVDTIDGEKKIRNIIDSFDNTIVKMSSIILNTAKFIDSDLIKITVKLNNNLREDMFRGLLLAFSNLALSQYRSHKDDQVKKVGDMEILIGYRILVSHIIQKTYRKCILRGVDLQSKLKVLESVRNIYSNSRINDPHILQIKESVSYIIDNNTHIKREQTKTALKLGFVTYIILLTLK